MTKLDQQLQALEAMTIAQLQVEWERVYKGPAPRLPMGLLRHGVAYKLQERALGRLSRRSRTELKRLRLGPGSPQLKPGTRLLRSWNGRTVSVLVTETGFLFEEREYRSLSSIANRVTGAAWSGPRFFGLKNG